MQRKLIFYSSRPSVQHIKGMHLSDCFMDARPYVLSLFEAGTLTTLLVPITMCTGWSVDLSEADVDVEFVGCDKMRYGPHRQQARLRLKGADALDDDHPLWLINEQIKGLLEGHGASEDHESVVAFLRATGLPDGTVTRMHRALVHGDSKSHVTPNA